MKTTTPGTSSTPLLARLARGDDETATARAPGTRQPADGTDADPLKQLASPPPQRPRSRREQPNPRHVPGDPSLPSVSDAMAEIRLQIDLESAAIHSDRSDRAWATRSEAATSSFHSAVDSPSRLQTSPSPSRAGHGRAEQTPASHQECADQIRDHLSRYEATPDAPDATETQAHLEQEYIDWAAERQLQRHAAFGPNGGYRFNVDMHATGTDASLPVAYETLKGFLTSALRVPPEARQPRNSTNRSANSPPNSVPPSPAERCPDWAPASSNKSY
ncbi:hypothetical protein ACFQGW_08040 [Xanthomonas theicola]|uniref:hypothetical protein n=1 Tax=Xanthomonas theicola TaxID=56464 RepID=UPI003622DC36